MLLLQFRGQGFRLCEAGQKVRRAYAGNSGKLKVGGVAGNDAVNFVLLRRNILNRVFKIVPQEQKGVFDGAFQYRSNGEYGGKFDHRSGTWPAVLRGFAQG